MYSESVPEVPRNTMPPNHGISPKQRSSPLHVLLYLIVGAAAPAIYYLYSGGLILTESNGIQPAPTVASDDSGATLSLPFDSGTNGDESSGREALSAESGSDERLVDSSVSAGTSLLLKDVEVLPDDRLVIRGEAFVNYRPATGEVAMSTDKSGHRFVATLPARSGEFQFVVEPVAGRGGFVDGETLVATHAEAGTGAITIGAKPETASASEFRPEVQARGLDASDRRLASAASFSPGITSTVKTVSGSGSGLNVFSRGRLDGTVEVLLNFQNAPWPVVLRQVAKEAGMAVELRAVPAGAFSYTDAQPRQLRDALDILNGFLIRDGFILIQHGRLLLLSAIDAIPFHLVEVIRPEGLGDRGDYDLVTVEVGIDDASAPELAKELESLLSPVGKIVAVDAANKLMVTDICRRVKRIVSLIREGDRRSGEVSSKVIRLLNTSADDVVKSLQQVFGRSVVAANNGGATPSPNGTPVVSVLETNVLIVTGPEAEIQKITALVDELDRAPPQVHIRAMLLEVELNETDELGVELGIQDSLLFNRSIIDNVLTVTESIADPATGIITTTERIVNSTNSPGFNFNNAPLGNNTSANPGRLAGQALSNLSVGRTNADQGYGGLVLSAGSESLSILVRALSANRRVNILSRPTIRTVHNRKASMQLGSQVPVIDGVSLGANGNANPVVRQDKAGIILEVTPKIGDQGHVYLDVQAEKSEFRTGPGSGTPIFTDANNGNVIEAPIKDVTEAVATVCVASGQTVVIGGMITSASVSAERRVPGLSQLPVIGRMFRYEFETMQRKELLIFLTPQVVFDDAQSAAIANQEIMESKLEIPATTNSVQGLLPERPRRFRDRRQGGVLNRRLPLNSSHSLPSGEIPEPDHSRKTGRIPLLQRGRRDSSGLPFAPGLMKLPSGFAGPESIRSSPSVGSDDGARASAIFETLATPEFEAKADELPDGRWESLGANEEDQPVSEAAGENEERNK